MQKTSFLFSLLGSLAFAAGNNHQLLKGALVLDDVSKIREERIDQIEGVQLDGNSFPNELALFLSDFPFTRNGALGLSEAITSFYENQGEYRMSVTIPEQDMSSGVAQLVVMPERLGALRVKQNRYSNPNSLTKWVRLSESEAIHERILAEDIGWLNTNPFRSVKATYQANEKPGVTDIDLVVSDRKSWKISTGVANTGTLPIGTTLLFGGLDVNDFIFTDHTLNVQATAADHFSEYQSYTANYIAPLPWRNTLKIFGAYSAANPNRTGYPQKQRQSYRASARYVIPYWFTTNPWVDQLDIETGFDFKGANSNLIFESDPTPVEKKLAYISQLAGGIRAKRNRESNQIFASLDFVGSPTKILPHQEVADFNNLREGATPQYLYTRLNFHLKQNLPNQWKLMLKGRAQFSFSTLIPSEQFSLGGYSTVRGYQERAFGGDNALCGNFEMSTPNLSFINVWAPKIDDRLTFLGFVDTGYAWFNQSVEGKPDSAALLSFGAGLRYFIAPYFTSRLDIGFPTTLVDNSNPRIHFNTIFSY